MSKTQTRRLVESAVMIAIGTVLSMFQFRGPWALGGGITFCSMLPLVLVSWRYGCWWGLFTAFVHSLLQMLLGISNVQYATNVQTAVLIILFDYIIAYSVIGLASMFKNRVKNQQAALVLGIAATFLIRLACHYLSGVMVWEVLWPNELGWAAPIWSISYNGSYMVPEIVITSIVAVLSYRPMKKYYQGEDLK